MDLSKPNHLPCVLGIVLIVSCAQAIFAQSGTASVRGTVFDQQGNVVVSGNATLSNVGQGFTRSNTINESGAFLFLVVPPGNYRLEVQATGFKRFVQTEVRALVDTPAELTVVLEAGNINETVTVSSNAANALLNTQDATMGNPFNTVQVAQLPTEARNVINLLTLQPGVTRFGYVAGGRSDQANLTLDGVDINEAQTNDIFNPVLRLNAEAIDEFRVTTANPNASQGRSGGAQISLVTKSGTNQLRGALFLTGRRTGWTANDFFNNRSGVERPKFDRNVFGGAIGGPIWKDRVFFFYSYEGERTTRGETVVRIVPLPNLGQGIIRFRDADGDDVSIDCSQLRTAFPMTGGCNTAALAVFADAARRYPANSFEVGDGIAGTLFNTAGFRFNSNNKFNNNSHVLRLDFNLSTNQQVFFRTNIIGDQTTSSPRFPDTPSPKRWEHPLGLAIGHNWTISSDLINNFRYGLTRDAFSAQGDSSENGISFPGIFTPRIYARDLTRITPVHNIADDVSWIWRNHTFQFGTNIRLISNRQRNYASAYDSANTLAEAYAVGSVLDALQIYGVGDSNEPVASAATALIGRYSSYEANLKYALDGSLLPAGTPSDRKFRTQEYDLYAQDIWRISPALTITAGLRYGLSRPVYEASGYESKPTTSLSEILKRRADGALLGVPYNQPITIDVSGPKNDKSPLYKWDKNNFQPRIAAAWSPNFGKGWLGRLFGRNNESVIRGGFGITNDYYGQQIAVNFDLNSSLGYASNSHIATNFYNLDDNVGPRFTGFNQNIRHLDNLVLPGSVTFPLQAPNQTTAASIEVGFDEDLVAPINYSWSLTYERTLPLDLIVSVSYLGRKARNLLVPRDSAAIANFVDTQSGMDWYTAAGQLETLRQQRIPILQVQQIAYFANLFPANLASLIGCTAGYNQTQAVYSLVARGQQQACAKGSDWTTAQLELSLLSSRFPDQHIFYQPQYGTYTAWSSLGRSDYQGLTFSIRQRLGTRLTMDFNYTYSKSMDDGSGLQTSGFFGQNTIINSFRPEDMYAVSNFDMTHIANANAIFKLPFGRGEPIFTHAGKLADLVVGGWQMTGIFRYNSGLPISAPLDNGWATNWTVRSFTTRIRNVETCPVRGGSLYGCDKNEAYRSFRNAYPGESGERNVFRLPGYWVLDMGIGKTFDLPHEGHKFQFRWEVFNVANTQKMGAVVNNVVGNNPQNAPTANISSNFANFASIQGAPRSMQFVLRYSF